MRRGRPEGGGYEARAGGGTCLGFFHAFSSRNRSSRNRTPKLVASRKPLAPKSSTTNSRRHRGLRRRRTVRTGGVERTRTGGVERTRTGGVERTHDGRTPIDRQRRGAQPTPYSGSRHNRQPAL